jgi:hypothetical protein
MKVSNNQKPTEGDNGVARETLNDWQKRDSSTRREANDSSEGKDKLKEADKA